MVLNLTDQERDYLAELLDFAYREKFHELHHADSIEFKHILKQRVDLIEALQNKLGPTPAPR